MRFGAPLTFANKDVFRRAVIKMVERSDSEVHHAERDGLPVKPPLQVYMRERVCVRVYECRIVVVAVVSVVVVVVEFVAETSNNY